jgi:hypothetical protein
VRKQLGDSQIPDNLTGLPLSEVPKVGSQVSMDAAFLEPHISAPSSEAPPFEGGAGGVAGGGVTAPVAAPQALGGPAIVPMLVSS